jgi:hypothetical protein
MKLIWLHPLDTVGTICIIGDKIVAESELNLGMINVRHMRTTHFLERIWWSVIG